MLIYIIIMDILICLMIHFIYIVIPFYKYLLFHNHFNIYIQFQLMNVIIYKFNTLYQIY